MPTIAEKARAEADQVEAEEQEEQPDQDEQSNGDEEQTPLAEPHPGDGLEEPSETMIAELQAACDEHHDRVHSIMGPFVEGWVPCASCNGMGLDLPRPAEPQLEVKTGTAPCPTCKGYGELALPTKRSGFDREQCLNCNGKGWVGEGNQTPESAARAAVDSYPADAGAQVTPLQSTQPPSTDPRVQELRDAGYIVLEKPHN